MSTGKLGDINGIRAREMKAERMAHTESLRKYTAKGNAVWKFRVADAYF